MGWLFYERRKGETNVEHFGAKYGEGYTLIDGATVGGVFYAAVRNEETGLVSCDVFLTKWVPNDPYNFGYKDMSESWGPVEARCPTRILDLLSPTEDLYGPSLTRQVCDNHYDCAIATPENEGKVRSWNLPHVNQREEGTGSRYAADEWRAACREYHARVKQVKRGTIIRLRTASTGEFFAALDLRRNVFLRVFKGEGDTFSVSHYRTRIPWWRNGGFEVVA